MKLRKFRRLCIAASVVTFPLLLGGTCQPVGSPLFEDVTAAAGITYVGQSYGAAWGDFDGDGLLDLWLGNHGNPPNLYLNLGDGTFADLAPALVGADSGDVHTAAWIDFDNDGDEDLVEVSGSGGGSRSTPNRVFVNTLGALQDHATDLGLDLPWARGRTSQWWDWDGDGRLDVALQNVHRADGRDPSDFYVQQADGTFQATGLLPESAGTRDPSFAQLADLDGDGDLEMFSQGWPDPNRIYDVNLQGFTDVTNSFGLPALTRVKDAVIADLNGDLQMDIFVALTGGVYSRVSKRGPGELHAVLVPKAAEHGLSFRTTGPVTFHLDDWYWTAAVAHVGSAGANPPGTTFTLDPMDPAVDGLAPHVPGGTTGAYIGYDPAQDVWQVRFSSQVWNRFALLIESATQIEDLTRIGFPNQPQGRQDRLFLLENGVFVDRSHQAGLDALTECESAGAGDFDNDMDLDLYLVCTGPAANTANILYLNQGDGTFQAKSGAGGATGSSMGRGDTVAIADYDADGFLDLIVTNGLGSPPLHDGPHQLFHNIGNQNHWIEIDLEGTTSNRDAIGARVTATAGGVAQVRAQLGGFHNRAQDQKWLHFGLGSHSSVDQIVVEWPSGILQTLQAVPADQVLRIVEP